MKVTFTDLLNAFKEQTRTNEKLTDTVNKINHDNQHAFDKIVSNQYLLNKKIENLMATVQERFDALLTRLDGVTNTMADNFKALLDQIKSGTVSDESLTKAEADISKLEAIGKPETPAGEPETPPVVDGGTGTGTGTTTDGSAGVITEGGQSGQ